MTQTGIESLLEQGVIRFAGHVCSTVSAMHGVSMTQRPLTEIPGNVFSGISVLSHFYGSIQGFYLLTLSEEVAETTFGYHAKNVEMQSDFFEFLREALNVACGQAMPFLEPMFGALTYSPAMVVQGTLDLPNYASSFYDLEISEGHFIRCGVFANLAEVKISAQLLKTQQALEETIKTAHSDKLTQMYNRHYFDLTYANLVSTTLAKKDSCSVIWIDVDFFKEVNDHYGHMVGDLALCHISEAIRKAIRSSDLAYRYGGDEFVVVLLGAKCASSRMVAKRVLTYLQEEPLVLETEVKISLSISVGVANSHQGDTPNTILQRADQQLYKAKENGRACVISDCDSNE